MENTCPRQRLLPGTVVRFVTALALFALFGVMYISFARDSALADGWSEAMRVIAMVISGALSYLPFAAAEWLLYALCAGVLIYVIIQIVKTVICPDKAARIIRMVSNLCAAAGVLLVLFFVMFGYAYFSTPVEQKLGLTVRPRSVDDLEVMTRTLLDGANEYAGAVSRNEDGTADFGTFDTMANRAVLGYTALGSRHMFLRASYAPVKGVAAWRLMASFGIAGIYIPYTAEALVNPDMPAPSLLFHMAHEMAHRLGVAPENEANFIAFLACREQGDRYLRYSAYFMAYRYSLNALYAEDPERALAVHAGVSDDLAADLQRLNDYIKQFEGPARVVGEHVNDQYLKSMSQPDGVKSYGRMVDLLLALYDHN